MSKTVDWNLRNQGLEDAALCLEKRADELEAKLSDVPAGTSYSETDRWKEEIGVLHDAAVAVRALKSVQPTRLQVVMGNDYPSAVCVSEDAAEAAMKDLRATAQREWERGGDARIGPRFTNSGNIYYRAYGFDLQNAKGE